MEKSSWAGLKNSGAIKLTAVISATIKVKELLCGKDTIHKVKTEITG